MRLYDVIGDNFLLNNFNYGVNDVKRIFYLLFFCILFNYIINVYLFIFF